MSNKISQSFHEITQIFQVIHEFKDPTTIQTIKVCTAENISILRLLFIKEIMTLEVGQSLWPYASNKFWNQKLVALHCQQMTVSQHVAN